MEDVQKRESRAKRWYTAFEAAYCLFCAALVVYYAVGQDSYHLPISIGALLMPPLLRLCWRLLRCQPIWQMNLMALGFIWIAYPLGSCLDMYRMVPGFDKLAHTLSGTFTALLFLALYLAIRPERGMPEREGMIAALFALLGAVAVAGLWEITEYLLSMVVHLDLQRVATTGVADSMQDMIVCLIGALLTLPSIARYGRGRVGFLTRPIYAFQRVNLDGRTAST